MNVRGIETKQQDLARLVDATKPHALILTETH
jgi:hypothetical protein